MVGFPGRPVTLYGGFRGFEQGVWQRPTPLAPTVLSGDYLRNDSMELYTDNSSPVVAMSGAFGITLSGLTISNGYGRPDSVPGSAGSGGIDITSSDSVTLEQVGLINHRSDGDGAAAYVHSSSVTFRDILVRKKAKTVNNSYGIADHRHYFIRGKCKVSLVTHGQNNSIRSF